MPFLSGIPSCDDERTLGHEEGPLTALPAARVVCVVHTYINYNVTFPSLCCNLRPTAVFKYCPFAQTLGGSDDRFNTWPLHVYTLCPALTAETVLQKLGFITDVLLHLHPPATAGTSAVIATTNTRVLRYHPPPPPYTASSATSRNGTAGHVRCLLILVTYPSIDCGRFSRLPPLPLPLHLLHTAYQHATTWRTHADLSFLRSAAIDCHYPPPHVG